MSKSKVAPSVNQEEGENQNSMVGQEKGRSQKRMKVNFKKVLEEPFNYIGFNNSLFSIVYVIVLYRLNLSILSENANVSEDQYKLNAMFTPVTDDPFLKNSDFVDWSVSKAKECILEKECFDAKITPLRLSAAIAPTLCKHSKEWPVNAGVDYQSKIKQYEIKTCDKLEAWNEDGDKFTQRLNKTYGLYAYQSQCSGCIYQTDAYQFVVPFYSAEIHNDNISTIFLHQLAAFEIAMKKEKYLQLRVLAFESINGFDHSAYFTEVASENKFLEFQLITTFLDPYVKTNIPFARLLTYLTKMKFYFYSIHFKDKVWVIFYTTLTLFMHCFYSYFEWADMKETYHYMIRKGVFEHKKEYSLKNGEPARKNSISEMVTATTSTMCKTLCGHMGANVYNVLDAIAIFLGFVIILLIMIRMIFDNTTENFPLGKPPGSIRQIENASEVGYYEFFSLYNGVWWVIFCIGWQTFVITISYLKKLAWHPGASIFVRTIEYAFQDLTDTAAIMLWLLLGFGMTSQMWFGAIGGDIAFKGYTQSTNTVSKLSFGLLDFADFMSWGYGQKYDGIGIGNAAWTKIIVFWMLFVLLNIIMLNLLIAVVSEGHSRYKENIEKRPHDKSVLFSYIFRRMLFFFFHGKFGIYESPTYKELKKNLGIGTYPKYKRQKRQLEKTQINWVHRMDLASSIFGKNLASACLNPAKITPTADWIEDFAVRIKGAVGKEVNLYENFDEHLIDEKTCRSVLSNIETRTDIFLLVVILLSQSKLNVDDEYHGKKQFEKYFKEPRNEIKEMVDWYERNINTKDRSSEPEKLESNIVKDLTTYDVVFICDHVELIWEIYKEELHSDQDQE
jgi:hypothetical protein